GGLTVTVTTPGGSVVAPVQHAAIAPALFTMAQVKAQDGTLYFYPAAVHVDGTLVGRSSIIPGSRPAVPRGTIFGFGTDFGPSSPPRPSGMIIPATPLDALITATMPSGRELVQSAYLISPGLYQFNIVIPASLTKTADDQIIIGFLGGAQSQG